MYKKGSCPTIDGIMPQPPCSIQQYLDDLTNPAMSDSLHSSTDTLVNPDTPTQPLDTIRQEDLSTIPLSLQLAFVPQSHAPITTERPNTIAPWPQYPNLSTYCSPQHPCGLAHVSRFWTLTHLFFSYLPNFPFIIHLSPSIPYQLPLCHKFLPLCLISMHITHYWDPYPRMTSL